MKTFVLAATLALVPSFATADASCRWYVHEKDKATWIEDRGETLVKRETANGNIKLVYDVEEVQGRPNLKRAMWVNSGGHVETFLFRFIEWNGERVLIADMDVYFQTCEQPKLPPV